MIRSYIGSNAFQLRHDVQQIVQKFVVEHGDLALERIDCEETEMPRIREALVSLPFLASKKLVVLRAPGSNKQFIEALETLLGEVADSTDVILIEPKIDKRSAYYKQLKKLTEYHEYGELDENGLAAWLVRYAKDQGGNISSNDARYLIQRVGGQQQLLANELDKLLIHSPQVTKASIDLLTEAAPQSTIFQLLEAAFQGHAKRALQLYTEQRALKVEAPQIVAMIAWQLHVLLVIKAAGRRDASEIASDAKVSPYVVQKSMGIARRLTLSSLKTLIDDLLDIDVRSKRSNLDIDEALQLYIMELADT